MAAHWPTALVEYDEAATTQLLGGPSQRTDKPSRTGIRAQRYRLRLVPEGARLGDRLRSNQAISFTKRFEY